MQLALDVFSLQPMSDKFLVVRWDFTLLEPQIEALVQITPAERFPNITISLIGRSIR
jgi:hypothetical protein